MPHIALQIPPFADFWARAARTLTESVASGELGPVSAVFHAHRLSRLHVVVSSVHHIPLLKAALSAELNAPFAAPGISTLSQWLGMHPHAAQGGDQAGESERLMSLYAQLRQHGWLKKMFAARRNVDLLPLAKTLVALCDELTCAMLPAIRQSEEAADEQWSAALEQLSAPARKLLSEETTLVWSVWKSQIDSHDPLVQRFEAMCRLADDSDRPLVWIGAVPPNLLEKAFLERYAARQHVLTLLPDWQAQVVEPACRLAWPEVCDESAGRSMPVRVPPGVALSPSRSLEGEAVRGAQTVLNWLASGRKSIAIVAQDRVVARRIRALLERADILVTDETGWKLSTTRAAASIAAWFDLVASRATVGSLLDLLKSPFVFAGMAEKSDVVTGIERELRRHKIPGGWHAVINAAADVPQARQLLLIIAEQANRFSDRRTLPEWRDAMAGALDALGMQDVMAADEAGRQVLEVIEAASRNADSSTFSFSEWRAFVCMQMEATTFVAAAVDRRVMMLPLSETRLRKFDAALIVGADAAHLPAHAADQLFFANGVRRELGLSTREDRHRQQMRDLTALLGSVECTVLSWQEWRNGEPNPASSWIKRLDLALRHAGEPGLPAHQVALPNIALETRPVSRPMPSAPERLPQRLSSSGFKKLVDCPYQFFALYMLGLSPIDEPADLPEKRDYGDWVHDILNRFHEKLKEEPVPMEQRAAILAQVSEDVFGPVLERHGAALSFYARWQGAMPGYLAWAAEREEQGWRYVAGECGFERPLEWPGGGIMLHGRVDRIDEDGDGNRAVLDYKTTAFSTLRTRLKKGEDHQLSFYGILAGSASGELFSAAHYVALELANGKIADVEAADYAAMQQQLEQQIVSCLQAISAGTPLVANGIETVCRFCEVRGLCRKGSWS